MGECDSQVDSHARDSGSIAEWDSRILMPDALLKVGGGVREAPELSAVDVRVDLQLHQEQESVQPLPIAAASPRVDDPRLDPRHARFSVERSARDQRPPGRQPPGDPGHGYPLWQSPDEEIGASVGSTHL